jgi:hypothetical protein
VFSPFIIAGGYLGDYKKKCKKKLNVRGDLPTELKYIILKKQYEDRGFPLYNPNFFQSFSPLWRRRWLIIPY